MSRQKRIDELLTYFKKEKNNSIFSLIVKKTNNDFNNYIEPLLDIYCPEIRTEKFYKKLILGSTELYSLGCYLIIFFSGKSYSRYRFISKKINLNKKIFLNLLPFIPISKEIRKKVIYASAFGVLIDHIFDIELKNETPKKRAEIVKKSFFKKNEGKGKLALLSYLSCQLDKKSIHYLEKWCDAEAKGLEKNKSIREYGVFGAIKLLYSIIKEEVSIKNYKLMIEIAYFVQMLDDYIDVEDDIKLKKITPVIEGEWTIETLISQYEKCVYLSLKRAKENYISPKYFKLIEDNLMYFVYNLIRKMANKAAN